MEEATAGQLQKSLGQIHTLSRTAVGLVWIYHGLVPKILFRDWSEMSLLVRMGVDIQLVPALLTNVGCLEIGLGLLILTFRRLCWPLWATIGIMIGSLLPIARFSPGLLHAAFNPVTLNGLMLALCAVALASKKPGTGSN